MPLSYEERIMKLQKEAMKPTLTRAREEKIDALISKYQGLILKRNAKLSAPPKVSRARLPAKTYEQKIMELEKKIIERDNKNRAKRAEPLRLKSTFVGPILPTQSRARTREQIMQEKLERANAKQMVKEALKVARMEARNLKKQQNQAKKLIKQGRKITSRVSGIIS